MNGKISEEYGRVIYTLRTFDSSRHDVDHRLVRKDRCYRATASQLTIQNDSRRRPYRRMLQPIQRGDPGKCNIVRVHYFVRGGFVGYRSRASSKHLPSLIFRSGR
ncbi:hypothetical protein TNCV_109451 [Trichonephila clavipes]|nr:hypothetical protein TNCV_109451 [Trichonephila clavipes]